MQHAPRSGNDYVRDLAQLLRLLHHIHAANNHANTQVERLTGKDEELVAYLVCELTSRSEHQAKDTERILR